MAVIEQLSSVDKTISVMVEISPDINTSIICSLTSAELILYFYLYFIINFLRKQALRSAEKNTNINFYEIKNEMPLMRFN